MVFVIYLLLGLHVNYNMPRGKYFSTDDYVCLNDGRGSCRETYVEELRDLDIPGWAKLIRKLDVYPLVILLIIAIHLSKNK